VLFLLSRVPEQYVLQYAVGILLAVLIGMTLHEFAHSYTAHLMGDPTPRSLGRLTLNPSAHIYWPGFLMFVILGFGILGTAPIAPHRMRNPRWGYLAAVAAGPFSNLLIAVVAALLMHLLGLASVNLVQISPVAFNLRIVLAMIVYFNLLLFVFNLLPLFPLDGWSIVYTLLPPDLADTWDRNKVYTQYAFFALILFSFVNIPGIPNPISLLISQPVSALLRVLNVGL
jgi:Zn-dependent protease